MIEAQLFRDQGVMEVFPSGPLTATDFEQLAALADPFIEANGDLKGLMFVAARFPGWDDFAALAGHIRFVRDHHRRIRRIAVVSDDTLLTVLPRIASNFVDAEIRHFPHAERDAAMAWLEAAPET